MTAQATAMPRQHPQGFTTVSGDRRHRRRALATAAMALAAPLFAVTVLAALGAATGGGGAGLSSLPGADGLKGASGTPAAAPQPLDADKWDPSKDYEKTGGGDAAGKRPVSTPPDSSGRDPVEKLPARTVVPVDVGGGGSPTVTQLPTDPNAPGYPGGDVTAGSGSDSGSGGSGSSGSDSGSGTGGGTGSGVSGGEYED
jgi:hypothetical protein